MHARIVLRACDGALMASLSACFVTCGINSEMQCPARRSQPANSPRTVSGSSGFMSQDRDDSAAALKIKMTDFAFARSLVGKAPNHINRKKQLRLLPPSRNQSRVKLKLVAGAPMNQLPCGDETRRNVIRGGKDIKSLPQPFEASSSCCVSPGEKRRSACTLRVFQEENARS